MGTVSNIGGPRQTPPESDIERAEGAFLDFIADWHVAWCRANLRWAEIDRDNRFGTLPEGSLPNPSDELDAMGTAETLIKANDPPTMMAAIKALEMTLTILEYREFHPENICLEGSTPIRIIRKVVEALYLVDGSTPLKVEKRPSA